MTSAFYVFAGVFAGVWLIAKLFDYAADVAAQLMNQGGLTRGDRSVHVSAASPSTNSHSGSLDTVGASNGGDMHRELNRLESALIEHLTESAAPTVAERRRLRGLTEVHKVSEGVAPQKSKPMRRDIH